MPLLVPDARESRIDEYHLGRCNGGMEHDQPREQATAIDQPQHGERNDVPPAAKRALAEAAERRAKAAQAKVERPQELNGRDGPDPARYGDWEKRGIASDF